MEKNSINNIISKFYNGIALVASSFEDFKTAVENFENPLTKEKLKFHGEKLEKKLSESDKESETHV